MSALSGPADNSFMKERKCNNNCDCAQVNPDESKPDLVFEYRMRACDTGNKASFLCVPKKSRRKRSTSEHLFNKIEDDFTRNHQSRFIHPNVSTGKDFNMNVTNEKKLEKRETKEITKNKEEKVDKENDDCNCKLNNMENEKKEKQTDTKTGKEKNAETQSKAKAASKKRNDEKENVNEEKTKTNSGGDVNTQNINPKKCSCKEESEKEE